MNRAFSKIWIIVILFALVFGGILAWQYWSKKEIKPTLPKEAKLLSFEIVPSCKGKAGWIIYQKGAKAIAKGENLSKVEFWVSLTGTGMKDILFQGEIIRKDNQWEALLPDVMLATDFYAVGYDSEGKKVGKISLGSVYGIEGYPEDCEENETADWKTYKNEEYGFEIKYPPFYQISEGPIKENFYNYQITKIVSFSNGNSLVKIYADNSSSNLANCLKSDNNKDLTQIKEINNNKFYVFWDKVGEGAAGGQSSLQSQYRIIHNNYCYILHYEIRWRDVEFMKGATGGGKDGGEEINEAEIEKEKGKQKAEIEKQISELDKILSTFRFLE